MIQQPSEKLRPVDSYNRKRDLMAHIRMYTENLDKLSIHDLRTMETCIQMLRDLKIEESGVPTEQIDTVRMVRVTSITGPIEPIRTNTPPPVESMPTPTAFSEMRKDLADMAHSLGAVFNQLMLLPNNTSRIEASKEMRNIDKLIRRLEKKRNV